MTSRLFTRLPRPLVALCFLALVSGCGTQNLNLVTGEGQRGAYSWAQQVQLGAEADQQIVAQYGLLDDAEVTSYVDRIGQNVLQSAYRAIQASVDAGDVEISPQAFNEIRQTPFAFRVLDSPVVNAFALPGGYTYVTRGLLAHLENEAQLAMVLGHEIGHVFAQHSSRRAFEAQRGQLGLVGAAIVGGVIGGGNVAQGILEYGSAGVQLLFLSYGRDAEREADQAGVAYSEFADYDAAEAARFFRSLSRIQTASGGSLPSFLSTHPDPAEREQTIPQLAAQYDGSRVNAEPFLGIIDGVVIGENPREGYVENGVFYHPDLAFSLSVPRGWQVSNTRQAVVMADPQGGAAIQLSIAQQPSAAQAAQDLRGQQGVSVSGQQGYSANGNTGVLLEGQAASQNGTVQFLASFVEYGGNVYELLGITSPQGYRTHGRTFRSTIESFDRVTDSRVLNRQPIRIQVVTADRTATFESFLAGRPDVPGLTDEGLAIINQTGLRDTIETGTKLKLPR